jgi:hypothetical protein
MSPVYSIDKLLTEMTAVVDISPYIISEEISSKEDPFHWQQPCCTELMAYKLHKNISQEDMLDSKRKIINAYIGIPWASFIDKKYYLGELVNSVKPKIEKFKKLAKDVGYTLKIHSVCQSIHWKRHLDHIAHMGVTDLHASHYNEVLSKFENPYNIKMHSWHLYAVNVEDSNRNQNIVIDEEHSPRPLLASFKGAHMVHYLSDVRLLLTSAAKKDKFREDVVVEIDEEWHFNKEVFGRQAGALKIDESHPIITNNDIHSYNDLLCRSTFSLCPEGAGINTIRFWESLAVGSVPVLILGKHDIPMLFKLHPELYKCCLVVFRDNVPNVFGYLRSIAKSVVREKKALCRKVYSEIKNQTTFENQHNTLFDIY